MNTSGAWSRPVLAGWEVSPAIAAQGAEQKPTFILQHFDARDSFTSPIFEGIG